MTINFVELGKKFHIEHIANKEKIAELKERKRELLKSMLYKQELVPELHNSYGEDGNQPSPAALPAGDPQIGEVKEEYLKEQEEYVEVCDKLTSLMQKERMFNYA